MSMNIHNKKPFFIKRALLFLTMSLIACGDSNSTSRDEAPSANDPIDIIDSIVQDTSTTFDGFIRILSSGKTTTLGTNEKEVSIEESPSMKVSFDYDFFIGRHEVTIGEYNELMHHTASKDSSNYPQANVTYYDAVLYANALSKQHGLDTVYTYSGSSFDEEHSCINLTSLKIDYTQAGFRLPTEAEWMFVAESYSMAPVIKSEPHANPVCSLAEKDTNICDINGNLKEWVNDWKGILLDTSITNYVGAASANGVNEMVLKGGSFIAPDIPLYSRGDFYTVTPLSKSEYTGFRLALGPIENTAWLNNSGKTTTSTMTLPTLAEYIRSLVGTFSVKLVFRNDETGNLAYINYGNAANTIVEMNDGIDAYHPDISPDGKYVAYCTGIEGIAGESSVYVRELSASNSNIIKLEVPSAAIPRFEVLDSGDTVIVYVTNPGNNKTTSTWKTSETWYVPFSGGKFGTPKKLLNGSFHGGVSFSSGLAVTGSSLLRATKLTNNTQSDELWYDGEQACNVSLSKDGSNRTLFLDFAGKAGISYAGSKYGIHEMLLVADSTGKLIQNIKSPKEYSFDHTEWAANRNIAVATLSNSNGSHQKIAIVDMESKKIVDLVKGAELWHPSLWVKPKRQSPASSSSTTHTKPYVLDEDSAGYYLNSTYNLGYGILRANMELLWKYHDQANVVVLGSSRPLDAIVPKQFNERFFVLNLAKTPNTIHESKFFLDHYVYPHVKNLRYIIISLDYDLWRYGYSSDHNFFFSDYKKFPGYVYDRNHNYWADSIPEGLAMLTEEGYADVNRDALVDSRGAWTIGKCKGWGSSNSGQDSTTFSGSLLKSTMNIILDLIKTAEERNVYVIGVIFPVSPNFKNSGRFATYGTRRSIADSLTKVLSEMQSTYPHFRLLDENKMGDHDYTNSMAEDAQHLCPVGAKQLTHRIDSLLMTIDSH